MENPDSQTELLNNIRHNSHNRFSLCSRKRHCRKEITCEYCWNRKRSFIVNQTADLTAAWRFSTFTTVAVMGFRGNAMAAFLTLKSIRSLFHKRIFQSSKFICFSVVATQKLDGDLRVTPHWHFISDGTITSKRIRLVLSRVAPELKFNIQVKSFSSSSGTVRRIVGYCMDNNYRPSLTHKPKHMRLISASRGLFTGRPRRIREELFDA
ncbi:MAG: hypothetical protein EOP05_00500 [Proteobacteria bacterium]|nr:MAG: hypothetical protein EOP05_00500 [Pseudomonadota bacterium]